MKEKIKSILKNHDVAFITGIGVIIAMAALIWGFIQYGNDINNHY